ncbi:unnamed protein product, partial [Pocillopora meandrina]
HYFYRTPINYLIVNLAISDIMYAVFMIPKNIMTLTGAIHPDGMIGLCLCKFVTNGNIAWIGGVSSIITLVAVAFERYYAVVYPFNSERNVTTQKLRVIIPCAWLFSTLFISPLFFIIEEEGRSCVRSWPKKWMSKAYNFAWSTLVFVSLLVMIVLYSRVIYALCSNTIDGNKATRQQQGVMRVRKRVTLMVIIVSVIFGICWATLQVCFTLMDVASVSIGPLPFDVAFTMVLFNSAINPFVYALLNQQFKEKMKGMICGNHSLSRIQPSNEIEGKVNTDNTTNTRKTSESKFKD